MSGAQRQARYMDKLLAGKSSVTKQQAVRSDYSALVIENATLKQRITKLEQKLALAGMASGKLPESVAEMDAMRRVSEELAAAKRARAKAERQAKAPPVDTGETVETLAEKLRQRDQQLKGAQTRIRNLMQQVRALADKHKLPVSNSLYREINYHCHPDRWETPKAKERAQKCLAAFNGRAVKIDD
jgi:DNA repair exonuclease SbcCD ATPase subunit